MTQNLLMTQKLSSWPKDSHCPVHTTASLLWLTLSLSPEPKHSLSLFFSNRDAEKKNYQNLMFSCLRDWRFSAIMGAQLRAPLKPLDTWDCCAGLRGSLGTPMMPRETPASRTAKHQILVNFPVCCNLSHCPRGWKNNNYCPRGWHPPASWLRRHPLPETPVQHRSTMVLKGLRGDAYLIGPPFTRGASQTADVKFSSFRCKISQF